MKKNFFFAAIAAVTMSLSSCGLLGGGTVNNPSANDILGTVLTGQNQQNGGLLGTVLGTNGSSSSLLGAVMGQLLQGSTTQQSLQGTWTYAAPKVVFESDNVLAQLGSTLASSKIESTLNTYISKIGMKAGSTKVTFQEDGVCLFYIKTTPVQGTYSYDSKTKTITLNGAFGLGTLKGYASVVGNELDLVFDAKNLLNLASKGTSSLGTTGSTLSSLLGQFNGLKIGMAFTK